MRINSIVSLNLPLIDWEADMVAAIGEIVRNGVMFDMKNWEEETFNPESLPDVVTRLFTIFEERETDYLLVGGIALLSYVEGRNTQDVDFILSKSDLAGIPEIAVQDENQDFVRGDFSGLQIDLLLTQNKVFDLVQKQFATVRNFGGRSIRTVTVEGLVLLKLYALPSLYCQGRFDLISIYESDVTLLLMNYAVDLEALLKLLSKYLLESDLLEIRETVTEIQGRLRRFERSRRAEES
jgi:hypothetical protein